MSGAPVVVVGGGVGGLSAALRLARHGVPVHLVEARATPGGLASGLDADGVAFDGGPYVLLDRPGLAWAFDAVGLDLRDLRLQRLDDVYEVAFPDGVRVSLRADLDETVAGLERRWPGSGPAYRAFVARGAAAHHALEPALRVSRPGLRQLLARGGWRHAALLARSLGALLRASGLPAPVRQAIAIWTHVAGQHVDEAPGFMAMLPALIHGPGAWRVDGGVRMVPETLARALSAAGVTLSCNTAVRSIRHERGRVTGVDTSAGFLDARAVVSNAGLATYLALVKPPVPGAERLGRLPLQSPGVGAWLRVDATAPGPYLRFRLPADGSRCRLLVASGDHARLLSPMDHGRAEAEGRAGQEAWLDAILAEPWWREHVSAPRVVARRVADDYGAEFRLWRNAMNPVMTASFARAGRLPHRSPWLRGLYLAGASTHPGQWVSFCAVSGVLAADCVRDDLA